MNRHTCLLEQFSNLFAIKHIWRAIGTSWNVFSWCFLICDLLLVFFLCFLLLPFFLGLGRGERGGGHAPGYPPSARRAPFAWGVAASPHGRTGFSALPPRLCPGPCLFLSRETQLVFPPSHKSCRQGTNSAATTQIVLPPRYKQCRQGTNSAEKHK